MSGAKLLLAAHGGAPGSLASSLPDGSSTDAGSAQWALNNDGTYTISTSQTGDWITPASATLAAFYQIKVDPTSGTFDGGAATGTWLDLSTDRSWSVTEPSDNTTKTVTFTASIREKATGVVRRTFVGLTLSAEDSIID